MSNIFQGCVDEHVNCPDYARLGACSNSAYSLFMVHSCRYWKRDLAGIGREIFLLLGNTTNIVPPNKLIKLFYFSWFF
jgi:ShK domain-like